MIISRTPLQDIRIDFAFTNEDIGGTNATSAYYDLKNYASITFFVLLGDAAGANWHASDILDSCYALQATNAAAGGSKVITGADIDAELLVVTNKGGITVHANALDVANDFDHVALYVAEGGNSGADYVNAIAIRHGANFHYDDLNGLTGVIVL